MSIEIIARRYSAALADVVLTNGTSDSIKTELAAWSEIFKSSGDLQAALSNPAISHTNKEKVLDGLIARVKPSQTMANFLKILLHNGRFGDIVAIGDKFDAVLEERSGYVSAEITTARELPEVERADFQKNLENLTGKKVRVNYSVNTNIIGGVVTRIGSTVYDGSVKTKLENLKEQLVNG